MEIKVCEHITINGDLLFDNQKDAEKDIEGFRTFMSKFTARCKVCGSEKTIYQTHDA